MTEKEKNQGLKFGKSRLFPQEEMLETARKSKSLIIGIPRESWKHENRVGLTPEAVELLVNQGHEVRIEHNAGQNASYSDTDYSDCGGTILDDAGMIYQSDIILKIASLTKKELSLLKGNQMVLSSLHVSSQNGDYYKELMRKKITAIGFENIRDKYGRFPVVRSMSEIAGLASILLASEYLDNVHGGKGVLLGGITGITPAEVVILGAGTAAEFATRAALGLGATVKIFDPSVHKLKRLQNYIGTRLQTSVFHPRVLEKSLKSADVVIGAIHLVDESPRFYVTEEMVKKMKKGSVIVDISIDQGGCVETSECRNQGDPVVVKHGVIHYAVSNIPSRVARTASIALSNVFAPILMNISGAGGVKNFLREDPGLRKGVYLFNGILTNPYIGRKYNILSKDIDLLLAAF